MSTSRLPTYYVSHGVGPWPYMKDQLAGLYDKHEASIVDIRRQIGGRPSAVLVVTGHWSSAPVARSAHPHEDHLLPLMVAVGAAEDETASCVYHQSDFMGAWTVSSFRFGAASDSPCDAEIS